VWFRSPGWRETVYWALDLETSGLDPQRDAILSVGMVPIRDGIIRWGERYYSLVSPPADHVPSPEAMRIHFILPEEARAAPPLNEIWPEIARRLRRGALLVHYHKLDVAFLRRVARGLGRRWPAPDVVDTVKLLARVTHRRRLLDPYAEAMPTDLGKARSEFGLPAHRAHHALYDALATAELFLALVDRLAIRSYRQVR